jgi:CRP/FNR family transcriptional regulator, cyclic AMP receptor protein
VREKSLLDVSRRLWRTEQIALHFGAAQRAQQFLLLHCLDALGRRRHATRRGNTVFYIQKGSVKLTVLSEQGKEAVVGILEPGQFFGEGCLNGHPLRIATTTAMEECVITSITKEAMIAALHTEPKFFELFMAYLLTRNSRVEEDLIDQLCNSSEKRLARLLLLLAHLGKEGRPQPILVEISQETLA